MVLDRIDCAYVYHRAYISTCKVVAGKLKPEPLGLTIFGAGVITKSKPTFPNSQELRNVGSSLSRDLIPFFYLDPSTSVGMTEQKNLWIPTIQRLHHSCCMLHVTCYMTRAVRATSGLWGSR